MRVTLRRPAKEDVPHIIEVFHKAISYAFRADGIADRKDGITTEVEKQCACLQSDFDSNGRDMYYLIAETGHRIVGTIAYRAEVPEDDFVRKNLTADLTGIPEITSAYVLPDFQGKGIGSLLFNAILLVLTVKQVRGICMDGGYQKSIRFWTRKIGAPDTVLEDYWGEGLHHVFWYRDMKSINVQYRTPEAGKDA